MTKLWVISLAILSACSRGVDVHQPEIKPQFDIAYEDLGYSHSEEPMMWFYDGEHLVGTIGARGERFQSFGPPRSLEKCAVSARFCLIDPDFSELPMFIRTSDDGWKPEPNEESVGHVSVSHDGNCQTYKLTGAGGSLEYRACGKIGIVEMQSAGSKGSHHLVLRSFKGLGGTTGN